MNTITRLTHQAALTAPPRYRERPRISLQTGLVVAQSIQLSCVLPVAATLDLACGLARAADILVSIGVGRPTMLLPVDVATALSRAGVEPWRIELLLAGPPGRDSAIESLLALSALRDQGVQIALGGFGGAGTLDAIEHLPLSTVILDPGLLQGLPGRAGAATRLHALLGMVRRQGLRVVATGIESEAQRAILAGLGCDEGEGSLFGRATLQRNDGGPGEAVGRMQKH